MMSLDLTFTELPGEHVGEFPDFTHAQCSLKWDSKQPGTGSAGSETATWAQEA